MLSESATPVSCKPYQKSFRILVLCGSHSNHMQGGTLGSRHHDINWKAIFSNSKKRGSIISKPQTSGSATSSETLWLRNSLSAEGNRIHHSGNMYSVFARHD